MRTGARAGRAVAAVVHACHHPRRHACQVAFTSQFAVRCLYSDWRGKHDLTRSFPNVTGDSGAALMAHALAHSAAIKAREGTTSLVRLDNMSLMYCSINDIRYCNFTSMLLFECLFQQTSSIDNSADLAIIRHVGIR